MVSCRFHKERFYLAIIYNFVIALQIKRNKCPYKHFTKPDNTNNDSGNSRYSLPKANTHFLYDGSLPLALKYMKCQNS